MAHSNSTQYYHLPQFDSTDKPAWLVDVNPAYAAIDAGIHAANVAADAAQGDATQALSDASAAGTAASGADAKAAGSIASLADTFDPTATYNIGDLVMYNNLLYICIVEVTVPGAWTGSGNWNRTTAETEINKKQDTIDRLSSVSALNDTDAIAVYDGTNTKKTTAGTIVGLVFDNFSNTFDTEVDISTYVGDTNKYTFPSNGYLNIENLANTNGHAIINDVMRVGCLSPDVNNVSALALFVTKGMTFYIRPNTAFYQAKFFPFA